MRGALIHGVLLAVMLVYGYRTWTRDKTSEPTQGNVVLWEKSEGDLVSIEYKAKKKIVKIERKPEGYWWGVDTTIEMKPKPPKPGAGSGAGSSAGSDAGSAAGSAAGSGAGSGSGAKPPPPPIEEEEVGRKTHEFPLGDAGDKLIKDYASAHALRDLGIPNEDQKKDYKLNDATTTITITFKDGPKTFLVGGSVYGGSDKYAVDQASKKAYVLSKDLISGLEIGESSLHLLDPRGFDAAKLEEVVIEAGGKSKDVVRIETEADGQKRKTWADADTKKPNQTAANFVDNANNLRPTEYAANLKVSDMQLVLKLTYKGERGGVLGTMSLYRYEKAGALQPEQELDPANPPKGETEYYIMTERTRVPGLVRKDTAERTENDIETVFSGKQPDGAGSGAGSGAVHSIDPHGNPLGKIPPGALGSGASGSVMPPPPGHGPPMQPKMPLGESPPKAAGGGSAAAAPAPKPPAPKPPVAAPAAAGSAAK